MPLHVYLIVYAGKGKWPRGGRERSKIVANWFGGRLLLTISGGLYIGKGSSSDSSSRVSVSRNIRTHSNEKFLKMQILIVT